MTTPAADVDTAIRVEIFRRLSETAAVPTVETLAESTGIDPEQVGAALDRLAAGRAVVLRPGTRDLWMANPFSCVPTGFEVRSGGKSWYGNCIWDSFGILGLLNQPGTIRSACPDCAEPLEVRAGPAGLESGEGLVHFAVPARQWWDDIGYT